MLSAWKRRRKKENSSGTLTNYIYATQPWFPPLHWNRVCSTWTRIAARCVSFYNLIIFTLSYVAPHEKFFVLFCINHDDGICLLASHFSHIIDSRFAIGRLFLSQSAVRHFGFRTATHFYGDENYYENWNNSFNVDLWVSDGKWAENVLFVFVFRA